MDKTFQSKIVIDGKVGKTPYEKICASAGEDSGACYLAKKSDNDTKDFAYDETVDNNLRYIGATPSNYVYFNCEEEKEPSNSTCETWRIIGVMNNVTEVSEDGQNKETNGSHLKIIRDKFDKDYSWDSTLIEINSGQGVNEWSASAIEKVLNDEYLNRQAGLNLCYKAENNTTETCPDWKAIGIREEARNMISRVKWNTGTMSVKYDGNTNLITASYMYEAERSNHNGKEQCLSSGSRDCNDEVERRATWSGKVGLMYPSDYGYAVGTKVRETCLGKSLYQYNSDDCMTNDWLYNETDEGQWTMTPTPSSSEAYDVFFVYSSGLVGTTSAFMPFPVRPTLYLKSNIKIKLNDDPTYGSKTNPYILER